MDASEDKGTAKKDEGREIFLLTLKRIFLVCRRRCFLKEVGISDFQRTAFTMHTGILQQLNLGGGNCTLSFCSWQQIRVKTRTPKGIFEGKPCEAFRDQYFLSTTKEVKQSCMLCPDRRMLICCRLDSFLHVTTTSKRSSCTPRYQCVGGWVGAWVRAHFTHFKLSAIYLAKIHLILARISCSADF